MIDQTGHRWTAIVILAAGSSSRMGQSKQLLPVEGVAMLRKIAEAALRSEAGEVIVVLGHHAAAHQKALEGLPVEITVNPNWEKGMGTSIKHGVQYLLDKPTPPELIVISVCDQPMLTDVQFNKLISAYHLDPTPVIASSYANTVGVPALFDDTQYEALMHLPDDHGAKKLLQHHTGTMTTIPFPGGEIDLDTPEDYDRFK